MTVALNRRNSFSLWKKVSFLLLVLISPSWAFPVRRRVGLDNSSSCGLRCQPKHALLSQRFRHTGSALCMAQVSEKEAKAGIDRVVNALRRDKAARDELGNLVSVNNILGYGSPTPGTLLLRFNASFRKGGMGRSSVPLPFGLGQSNETEGRGTMVGQVKASVDSKTGKVTSCSVFRDLGYGRAFNLKV